MNNEFLVKKVMPVVLGVVIFMTIIVMVTGGKNVQDRNLNNKGKSTQSIQKANGKADASFTGVISSINEEKNEIVIYNIKYENKFVMSYSGGTDIRNKYDKIVAMSSMSIGQIVDVGYIRKSMKVTSLKESSKGWEYKKLTNFKVLEDESGILINGDEYSFGNQISVTMDGVDIDISKVIGNDEITVRGIKNYVYSIVVTKGHGTISFENEEALLGGLVMVGNYNSVEMEENLVITAAEGTYTVWFVNGKLKGEKTVKVSRNEETKVDVGDIYLEPTDTALVTFDITPSKAMLYIDGTAHKFDRPVELEYGKYDIDVDCDGYQSYKGKIDVNEAAVSVVITLSEDVTDKNDTSKDNDGDEDKETVKPEDNSKEENQENSSDKSQKPSKESDTDNNLGENADNKKDTETENSQAMPTPKPNTLNTQDPNVIPTPKTQATAKGSAFSDGSGGVG